MKMMQEKIINVSGTVKSLEPGGSVTFASTQARLSYLYCLCSQLKERGMRFSVNKVAEGLYRVTRHE